MRKTCIIPALLAVLLAFAACPSDNGTPVAVTGVSLNRASTGILIGNTITLSAEITPSNATNKNVRWSSSDTSVAAVSEGGVVTAVSLGTAAIIVTTVDGGKTAFCTVTVGKAAVAVTGVSLNKTSANILIGAIETLSAAVTPTNATNQSVTWSSSNTAIATVSTDGVVVGVSAGTATITVTTIDGGKNAACTVTVSPIAVTRVFLKTATSILVNKTETLYAVVEPSNATNKNVTWSSNNTAVATVSTMGVVTGVSEGTATITVTTVDGGKTASCTVTVSNVVVPVTGVSLDKSSASLVVGGTEDLTATISPNSATNQNVTWGSSNTTVAEVSAGGVVTAKNVGTATITVTTNDGSKTASCNITVNKAAGAEVSAPTGTSSVTSNSITINAVSAPNNGQSVEYAINTENTVPLSGWQDGTTFNGLNAYTTYYIFARSKENTNYNSGTQSISLQVITLITLLVEMVYVPGGNFEMGKELGTAGEGDVTPVHTVTLTGFYIGKYQVTQAQYKAVMGSNPSYSSSTNPASGEVQGNRPVEQVSWYDAIVFCNKLSIAKGLSPAYSISGKTNPSDWGTVPTSSNSTWNSAVIVAGSNGYRLPTDAQWEYAAKGGSGTPGNYTYSGSNTIGDVAWYKDNSGDKIHEVGKKAPNGLGIYDMSGNVYEWCWDWWRNYSSGEQTDPQGAASGVDRVMRGGSFGDYFIHARSVNHNSSYPYYRSYIYGFRLVCP